MPPLRRRGPSSGTAYLRRRQAALSSRDAARQRVWGAADAVHSQLSTLAVATHRHRPQDQRLTGDERAMILNAAYLVDDARVAEFARAVASAAREHSSLALELTGPWPPYSFAAVEEEPGSGPPQADAGEETR